LQGHTIRVKPPLCVTLADADFLLEVMDAAFTKLEAQGASKPQPALAAA
jgi:4-aminobutyrate aminotransferase-like enzyme